MLIKVFYLLAAKYIIILGIGYNSRFGSAGSLDPASNAMNEWPEDHSLRKTLIIAYVIIILKQEETLKCLKV